MLNKIAVTVGIITILSCKVFAQENYKSVSKEDSVKAYLGGNQHEVKYYEDKPKSDYPKNIILMIGDGMGTSQIFAGVTANGGSLFLDNFNHLGFSKTQSASSYITDSAAGGTALSSGYKTYNGAIGVDVDTIAHPSVRAIAEDEGMATGLVSTSAITHATPASFIAHQPSRTMYEEIAGDLLKTDIDVFIGGGYKHFADRKDRKDLITELKNKGYKVLKDIDEITKVKEGKLAGLTALTHNPEASKRNGMLPKATETAINILSKDDDGFFLMVEGSQIDWGGHQNNTTLLVEEMLDFDEAIGKALEFAAKNGETLIVITADHETGGFALTDGDIEKGMVKGDFIWGEHTAVMVPIFAFGPGAEKFTGIMENSEVGKILIELVKYKGK
ncbi:MAG: alkaline phosphatase [Mangrovibacterium sp.]